MSKLDASLLILLNSVIMLIIAFSTFYILSGFEERLHTIEVELMIEDDDE